MKVYGPYKRKDGRSHVVLYDGKTRRTQSYPRFLMEQHLGRKLEEWEQVDHINDDFTDNRIENFQLLTLVENTRKSARPKVMMKFNCPVCEKTFEIPKYKYTQNQVKRGSAGPYCSKRCAGKIHH